MSKLSSTPISIRFHNKLIVTPRPPKIPSQAIGNSARIRMAASSVSRSTVRRALLAAAREFSPSGSNSILVNSSISLHSFSIRRHSCSVRSPALQVMGIHPSHSHHRPPVAGSSAVTPEVYLCSNASVWAMAANKRGSVEDLDTFSRLPHGVPCSEEAVGRLSGQSGSVCEDHSDAQE